jgi:hypothetical protein
MRRLDLANPAVLVLLFGVGCPKAAAPVATAAGPTVVPAANLFLRNAFDTDPSVYIGRFVPEGLSLVDETSAMPLTCSQHVGYRLVGGGGVVYDELFNSSSEAAARVGVPLVASASAAGNTSAELRVRYELTRKMVAEIKDPAAFEACCKAAPDQCSSRYIGEFLEGKGSIWFARSAAGSASAGGMTPSVSGDVEVKHGQEWQRSIEFPNPVYFGMKTTLNPYTGQTAAGCGPWVDAPPRSTLGQYFVGVSDPAASERLARESAMRDARLQVVRWVGESLTSGTLQVTTLEGGTSGLSARLDRTEVLELASSGVARLVKDEAWCVTSEGTPSGPLLTARVLALLPKAVQSDAAVEVAKASRPLQ